MRKRVKTEVFAELSDPVLFPRLSDAEIEQLAERGERRSFETDELLFEQGMRDAPFFVIEHGTVDILDRRPQEDVWFARMDGGTREPYLLETVRPGVFVAGDVRSESTKRVAGAVGDGALAVRFAHQVLGG